MIVTADDFGRSEGINRGVVRAHEDGIVTSASLMVRWPAARAAAAYARDRGTLDLGLHVDLAERVFRGEAWVAVYEVVPLDDESGVEAELERQLEVFARLVGRPPSHIDSHQHVHRKEPVRRVLRAAASRLGVALRGETEGIAYRGDFYGQESRGDPVPGAISPDRLVAILGSLPEGITELSCHPGLGDGLPEPYTHERTQEVEALCDPRVRAALEEGGVVLRGFPDRANLCVDDE